MVPLQMIAVLAQILVVGYPFLLSQAMSTMALPVQDLLALLKEYPDLPSILRCANTNSLLPLPSSRMLPSSGAPSPLSLLSPLTTAAIMRPLAFIVASLEAFFLSFGFSLPNLTFLGPF